MTGGVTLGIAVSKRGGERSRPRDLRASVVQVGGGAYVLLSFARGASPADGLTSAERQVALAVLAGYSNAEIARLRGSSPRTIANQLASIYRTLGVRSRAELAAQARSLGAG